MGWDKSIQQDLPFPLLVQDGQPMFGLIKAHPAGDVHALPEQLHNLTVNLIDLRTQVLKIFHYRYCSFNLT